MSRPAGVTIRSHRDLIVWQRALELIEEIYRLTDQLPAKEAYAITAQTRKAAISIAANIAEGHARQTTKEYVQFLSIANGALREVQTYGEICLRLKYLSRDQLARAADLEEQVGKMLARLIKNLRGRGQGTEVRSQD